MRAADVEGTHGGEADVPRLAEDARRLIMPDRIAHFTARAVAGCGS